MGVSFTASPRLFLFGHADKLPKRDAGQKVWALRLVSLLHSTTTPYQCPQSHVHRAPAVPALTSLLFHAST